MRNRGVKIDCALGPLDVKLQLDLGENLCHVLVKEESVVTWVVSCLIGWLKGHLLPSEFFLF